MDRVIASCVRNPFDAKYSRETREFDTGRTVREYVGEFFPQGTPPAGYDLVLSADGIILPAEDILDLRVEEGISLAFCLAPQGDGGGKNVLRIVALIAITAVSYGYLGPAAAAAWAEAGYGGAAIVGGVVAASATIAGGLLINALLPYQNPAESMSGLSQSMNYGWEPGGNYLFEGGPLPILYGKRRFLPPIIGRYIETVAGESSQYYNVLMAIGEGPVTAISNAADALRQNVRINRVAAAEFRGVTCEMRVGANTEADGQTLIQNFNDTYTDTGVGVKITSTSSWTTRTTAGNLVGGLRIGIVCPRGLGTFSASGGISLLTVKLHIEYKKTGDADWTRIQDYNTTPVTISTGRWSAGYWNAVEGFPTVTWVELTTGSTTPTDHNEGEPYTGTVAPDDPFAGTYIWRWIVSETVNQVGSVLNDYAVIEGNQASAVRKGWRIDALPEGEYSIRVKLAEALAPASTTVINDVYWEVFTEIVKDDFIYPNTALLAVRALATDQLSGTQPTFDVEVDRGNITLPYFGSKPSSNPAWACVDLLTNARYGGGQPIARIDTAAFQAWADFCDANSYAVNIYLDQVTNLRQALNMISMLGRGTVVQIGSKFTPVVDRVEPTPVQRFMFTVGNIARDSFREEWLPQDDRANVLDVEYFDATLDYERTPIEVPADDLDTTTQEVRRAAVVLYGCTSRTQAIRYAKFLLNCNRYLTLTASWDCDVDALACFPGDVVEVQHDVPQWGAGGRIVSATASTVTLDREVTVEAGKTYHVRVKHQDDDTFEELTVADGAGSYTTLNLTASWAKTPVLYALYSFGEVNFVTKLFRVLRISRAQDLKRKITAIEYYEAVYTDTGTVPAPPAWPTPKMVEDLRAEEVYREGSTAGIALTWRGYATPCSIFFRRATEATWTMLGQSYGNTWTGYGYDVGVLYYFTVSPSSNPMDPDGDTISFTLQGRAALPAIEDPVFIDARCTYTDKIQLEWERNLNPLLGAFELRGDLGWGEGYAPGSGTAANSYFSTFANSQNPLSEGGNWINGETDGKLWHDIRVASGGYAFGNVSSVQYSDPTAILAGSWGPDQSIEGTALVNSPTGAQYEECELLLRTAVTSGWRTGYEINNRAYRGNSESYLQIAKWPGYLPTTITQFTFLFDEWGTQFGVANGDYVKASIEGDLINVWVNSTLVASVTDPDPIASGAPGIGFNYGAGQTPENFGWRDVLAKSDATSGGGGNFFYRGKGTSYTMKPDGGPYTFNLKAVDTFGNYSDGYDSITLTPTVPVPVFVAITGLFQKVRIEWEPINDESYDVVEVWRSASNDRAGATKIGEIHSNIFVDTSALFIGGTYYYWIRTRSLFGTYSAWESGDTAGHSATTAQISTADLADAAISAIKLAADLKVPVIWSGGSLPTLPDSTYPEGTFLYWMTDGKLYRNDQSDATSGGGGTSVSDDFNRANEDPLSGGGNWICENAGAGQPAILSNQVYKAGSQYNSYALWNADVFADGQYAQARIAVAPAFRETGGPGVRCSSATGGIFMGYYFTAYSGVAELFCVNSSDGSAATIGSTFALSVASGDLLKLEVNSAFAFTLYKNGTIVATRADGGSFIASGRAGLTVVNSARLDDWTAGDVGVGVGSGGTGWTAKVDGADIIAASIIAGKIAAGAVGAAEVAADTMAVRHLVVADYSNMVWNPAPTAASSVADKWTFAGGSVGVEDFAGAPPSGKCFKLLGSNGQMINDNVVQVAPGEELYVAANLLSSSPAPGTLWFGAKVWTGVNSYTWSYLVASSSPGWGKFSGTITLPASATEARFTAFVDSCASDRYWLVAQPAMRKAAGGDMIVDGAITAAKVGANEVIAQTANLKDAVVETLKIAGNAVTVPVGAFSEGPFYCNSNVSAPTSLVAATINAEGETVAINFSCLTTINSGCTVVFAFYRDESYIPSFGGMPIAGGKIPETTLPVAFTLYDTPSSGTHDYEVRAYGPNTPSIAIPSIVLLGYKR